MGRATAILFAREGARVVLADRSAEQLAAVREEIAATVPDASAIAVTCDVSRPDDLSALVDAAVAEYGGIDILVNNAGVSRRNSVAQDDAEFEQVWQEVLDINLTAQCAWSAAPCPTSGSPRTAGSSTSPRPRRSSRRPGC